MRNQNRTRVHWNITRRCWSVLEWTPGKGWRLDRHVAAIDLLDAETRVSVPGREKVRDSGVKGVHADITGRTMLRSDAAPFRTEIAERIRYNPFRDDWFVTAEGVAVKRAERMRFNRNGTVYAIGINSGLQSSSTETQETGATS
jgi:hypothetical protein